MKFDKKMNQAEYLSSSKVIFSDRGSITLGILVIAFMVILSLSLFLLKFQKKTTPQPLQTEAPPSEVTCSVVLKHRFLFKPSRVNSLLVFLGPHPKKNANLSLNKRAIASL